MSPTGYDAAIGGYDPKLAELSKAFWAGMGGPNGKLLRSKIIYEEEGKIGSNSSGSTSSGFLDESENNDSDYNNPRDGRRFAARPIVVNGVILSQVAADQLRKLGLPLEWYTAGELEEAVAACEADSTLIDDDEGVNFSDRLHLGYNEHGEKVEPILHGFSKDEFEDGSLSKKTLRRLRKKEEEKSSALIPESEIDSIFAGMRLLCNPTAIEDHCEPVKSGVHHSKARVNDPLKHAFA